MSEYALPRIELLETALKFLKELKQHASSIVGKPLEELSSHANRASNLILSQGLIRTIVFGFNKITWGVYEKVRGDIKGLVNQISSDLNKGSLSDKSKWLLTIFFILDKVFNEGYIRDFVGTIGAQKTLEDLIEDLINKRNTEPTKYFFLEKEISLSLSVLAKLAKAFC